MRWPFTYAVILAGILAIFYGGIAVLWLSGRTDLYFALMHILNVDAFSTPFLDLSGVLSMGECHRMGIDVSQINPCDILHRRLNYGPLLLNEPFTTADTNIFGAMQSVLFLSAIPLVLRPRTWIELLVATAASLSCAVIYALERGNLDLVEFMLIATAAFFATRGYAGRLVSYLIFYAAGTLKFYPFALLITIARERLASAIALAAIGATAILAYGFLYRDMLARLNTALPPFEYNTDVIGAVCLPFGLSDWLELPASAGHALMGALVFGFGVMAWKIARRLQHNLQVSDFETVNSHLLIAGSIVLVGCFFMGPSISYRGIFLLLILRGLFDLAAKPQLRVLAIAAICGAIFCLWSEFFRHWGDVAIDHLLDLLAPLRGDSAIEDLPSIGFFAVRELVWWTMVSVMGAITGTFLLNARATRSLQKIVTDAPHAIR